MAEMSKGPATQGATRLCVAALVAAVVAIGLGPDDIRHQSYAAGMAGLVLLGGWIRARTDEGGLVGRIATGALGLLLLAPAMAAQVRMAAEALAAIDSTSPHTAVTSLPGTAASVVHSTGPLMAGAGLALLILGGRLGGPVTGALLGGATAAWAGHTLARALDKAIAAERYADLVELSQGLRFVGLLAIFGAICGAILARQGRASLTQRRIAAKRLEKIEAVKDARRQVKLEAARAEAEAAAAQAGKEAESEDGEILVFDDDDLSPEEAEALEAINETLYATPLLSELSDEELESIASSFERTTFAPGDTLFSEGDHDRTIFIVRRGEIAISKAGIAGEIHHLATMGPGMLFGEMAVIEHRQRSATATASGAVEVITLAGSGFDEICNEKPEIGVKIQVTMLALVSQRLRTTSAELYGEVKPVSQTEGGTDAPRPQGRQPVLLEEMEEMVASVPLFREMEPTDLDALAPILTQSSFADGETLISAGTLEPSMYIISSGEVEIWHQPDNQPKMVLALVSAGSTIGEMALFEDAPRSANVTATKPVVSLVITRSALSRLAKMHAGVAVKLNRAMLELLCKRLRRTSAQLVDASDSDEEPTSVMQAERVESDDILADLDDGEIGAEPAEEEDAPIVVEVLPEEVDPDRHLSDRQIKVHQRTSTGLAILATLTAYWAASPPWLSLLRSLPNPAANVDVPKAEPGIPNAQRPMNPFGPDFAAALENRGHRRMHSRPWPCLPDVYNGQGYGSHPRKTETLAVSADTPIVELTDAISDMRKRGVYRMGLTGRAKPPYGALGSFLAWPAVQLLIDSPPRTAQWITHGPRSLEKLELLPGATAPSACALLVNEEVTVDQLYATVRSLGSVFGDPACQSAITLVLPDDGSTTNPHPGWKGCP